jgi:hypothetical protein
VTLNRAELFYGSYREKGGDLINRKFSPANVAGEEGTCRLMQMIRTNRIFLEFGYWEAIIEGLP